MAEKPECPVCGAAVTPETAKGQAENMGQAYYFGSHDHQQAFELEPERYRQQQQMPR